MQVSIGAKFIGELPYSHSVLDLYFTAFLSQLRFTNYLTTLYESLFANTFQRMHCLGLKM